MERKNMDALAIVLRVERCKELETARKTIDWLKQESEHNFRRYQSAKKT
jgi:hypothetical protein